MISPFKKTFARGPTLRETFIVRATIYVFTWRQKDFRTRQILEGGITCHLQGLQILLMSGVGVTSTSQMLESFCNIWSQVSQRKKPFSDFPARGPKDRAASFRVGGLKKNA